MRDCVPIAGRKAAFTHAGYFGTMSFRKPFKAVPIKLSHEYQRKRRVKDRVSTLRLLTMAGAIGIVTGAGSVGLSAEGRSKIVEAVKPFGVRFGLIRSRAPQAGDFWTGCNDARTAGTAPIYYNEPGYREQMDGDGDGVACEPYH